MADILQDFPIKASPGRVFDAISSPEGLNLWWTLTCAGRPRAGAVYELGFGPDYQWAANVTKCRTRVAFELTLTRADEDWTGSRVGFNLSPLDEGTRVQFYHRGWPHRNAHYRTSGHCWALYLRHLRRYLEHGEVVPYDDRLDA